MQEDQLAALITDLDEEVRAFGVAVADHLSYSANGDLVSRLAIVTRISLLLDPEELSDDQAAAALIESPEILASFFQNADLLAAGGQSAQRVARVVTLALERAWEAE